jgi:ribosomal protein S18 acetylase RimI-like enzyme
MCNNDLEYMGPMRYSKGKIEQFLREVDGTFPVPISHKTGLYRFASKLFEKATICCVNDGEDICAMVAGYTENTIDNIAYVSLVATRAGNQGKGLATRLLKEFISICEAKGLSGVHLYTDAKNSRAVALYQKLGFQKWILEAETRKEDLHYIYWICGK